MSTHLKIAVLVESSRGYGRSLLQGITAYVREHGPWTVDIHERRLYDAAPNGCAAGKATASWPRIASPKFARQIALAAAHGGPGRAAPPSGRPGHHYRPSRPWPGWPPIICSRSGSRISPSADSPESITANGGRNISRNTWPSGDTRCMFTRAVPQQPGIEPASLEAESLPRAGEMAAWLRSLPKPLGLMAVTDNRGLQVLNVCGGTCDRRARRGGGNRRGQRRDALRTVRSAFVERGVESLEGRLRGGCPACTG